MNQISKNESTSLDRLVRRYALEDRVNVSRPSLPPLDRFAAILEEIWSTGLLTNMAAVHQRLEARLAEYLGVEHVSLVSDGTTALQFGLKCLAPGEGEVITTPFTFAATVHAIRWAGLTPVFADIDEATLNLDPEAVRARITPRTVAVLPVHVFGRPCQVEAFADLGRQEGLGILYDGAHAFGACLDGRSLASWGELTALSFHATKLFSTAEGGALVCASPDPKARVDLMRNHGIVSEEEVACVGINGKLSEVHSALGLLQLDAIETEISKRASLAQIYRERLGPVPGIRLPEPDDRVRPNHSFFPIRIDAQAFGVSRDVLTEVLRRCNVYCRKYFSPLISDQAPYEELESAQPDQLPIARRIAREVLCLPLYGSLAAATVASIAEVIAATPTLALRGMRH